jgi:formylglycine-generating enzyme required for sulfatase activity
MEKYFFLMALSLAFVSCMSIDDTLQTNFVPAAGNSAFNCPANYVRVPPLSPYTSSDFCVAKYEMKIQGDNNGDQSYNAAFVAESRASGTPWVGVNRGEAQDECQALGAGYDLILNAEWQTVARNVEQTAWNWSGGTVGSTGGISRTQGIASGQPASDDSDACADTGNTCSLTVWDDHRRVHKLSNGEYIWDLAGNVGEWMKDSNGFDLSQSTISQITNSLHKSFFGPDGDYSSVSSEPYAGLGDQLGNGTNGTIIRSGAWGAGAVGLLNAGIFATNINAFSGYSDSSVGFRCAYHFSVPSTYTIMQPYLLPDVAANADPTSYEFGVKFLSSKSGKVSAVRFYRGAPDAAGYTVSLWTNTGALLATGSGTDGTIPGWQEISLSSPVSITAGTTYVASYYTAAGNFPSTTYGLKYDYLGTNYLTAQADGGVFNAGAPGFPTATFHSNNYFVDVVFTPDP